MGFIEARINDSRLRGRFALQAGTSVQSNYAGEPQNGAVSGPEVARFNQEARLGYKLNASTWFDAGIFFAHVGAESWISKENLSLTRSLVADFSPYYLSGAKVSHAFNENWSFQFVVANGWQIISESNTDKTLGTSVQFEDSGFLVSYNTLAGYEVSPPLNNVVRKGEFRHYHNLILKNVKAENFEWSCELDIGFQKKPIGRGLSQWTGMSLQGRWKASANTKISARFETFKDLDQVVINTKQSRGLEAIGGSLGLDQDLAGGLPWKNELRYLGATSALFPKSTSALSSNNWLMTTSLALNF